MGEKQWLDGEVERITEDMDVLEEELEERRL